MQHCCCLISKFIDILHYYITLIFCVFLRFLLCMFLLYITVLLPVGVIKDDKSDTGGCISSVRRPPPFHMRYTYLSQPREQCRYTKRPSAGERWPVACLRTSECSSRGSSWVVCAASATDVLSRCRFLLQRSLQRTLKTLSRRPGVISRGI